MQRKLPKKSWFVADVEFKPIKWTSVEFASAHVNPKYRISLDRSERLVNNGVLRVVDVIPLLWYRRPYRALMKRRTKFH